MEGRGEGYWFLLWSYPNFVADCCCTGVRTFLLKVHTSLLPFNISLLCLYSLFFLFVDLWHLIPASRPCWLSSLLVLSCTPSTLVFSSPQKPTFSNSNSTRNQVDEEPLSGCTTSKSLFICNSFLAVVASGMVVVCKQCNNSQQRWELQWIVESIQPIRLWRPCVMRVRGPKMLEELCKRIQHCCNLQCWRFHRARERFARESACWNSKRGEKMGRVKRSGVGGRKREEKTRIFSPPPLSFFPPSTYP